MEDYERTAGGDPLRGVTGATSERAVEDQIAALEAQVRALGERLAARAGSGVAPAREALSRRASETEVPTTASLTEAILSSAESVAAEIRASAQREAEIVRASAEREAAARIASLRGMVVKQRETLAGVAAEIGQLERSAATLRAQARTLDAELAELDQVLGLTVSPQPRERWAD
jgi:uncharacterized coiled-coil protein SlyX